MEEVYLRRVSEVNKRVAQILNVLEEDVIKYGVIGVCVQNGEKANSDIRCLHNERE